MSQRLYTTLLAAAAVAIPSMPLSAYAAAGSVDIESPKNGAQISANTGVKVTFDVHHTANGNHLHFYEDNGNPTIVRKWHGSETLPPLPPGKHQICIKEATVDHVLTGLQKCIMVDAK